MLQHAFDSSWARRAPIGVVAGLVACGVLAGCTGPTGSQENGLDLTLRFDVPGQACLDQGFVGWMVEVRDGSAAGDLVGSAYIEPLPFLIDDETAGLEGDGYVFSDWWVGVLPVGDYHVRAYGVTDPGPPPVIATFMTPAETTVTLESGHTTEVVLVTSCNTEPGGLDVIVVVDGGPRLLDLDIDQKWVSVCEPTTFTATLANPEHNALTATWMIHDEDGDVVLSDTQAFPAGSPDPVESTFVAWLPTAGDYEGTLTVTMNGAPSVFAFPWHVRVPGIAVGACTLDDAPVVLMSCDLDDGLPLADDPACLDAAFDSVGGVLPTCLDLWLDECEEEDQYPPDPDTDGDGVPDTQDQCPGEPDVDDDNDGTLDCLEECDTNCTYSQGFWKTHPEAWPVQTLVIGSTSYTKSQLVQLLGTPTRGDVTYDLARQLIAARLNQAAGADVTILSGALSEADGWLVMHRLGSDPKGAARLRGIDLATLLESFNVGTTGPGHCDEGCLP